MDNSTVRTTITLPNELLEATDKAVAEGKAKNRNEFVAQALRRELLWIYQDKTSINKNLKVELNSQSLIHHSQSPKNDMLKLSII